MKTREYTKDQWLMMLRLKEKGLFLISYSDLDSIYNTGKIKPKHQKLFNEALQKQQTEEVQ